MHRILVLARRDWRRARPRGPEQFLHTLTTLMAEQGHFVAVVSARPRLLLGRREQPVEVVDGVQLARLDVPLPYRRLMSMLLSRMAAGGKFKTFNVVVEFVQGRSLPIGRYTGLPLLPVVFQGRGQKQIPEHDGPIVAASPVAAEELLDAGLPANRLVRAFADDEGGEAAANLTISALENLLQEQEQMREEDAAALVQDPSFFSGN